MITSLDSAPSARAARVISVLTATQDVVLG
jgi:hypothetical protein